MGAVNGLRIAQEIDQKLAKKKVQNCPENVLCGILCGASIFPGDSKKKKNLSVHKFLGPQWPLNGPLRGLRRGCHVAAQMGYQNIDK